MMAEDYKSNVTARDSRSVQSVAPSEYNSPYYKYYRGTRLEKLGMTNLDRNQEDMNSSGSTFLNFVAPMAEELAK